MMPKSAIEADGEFWYKHSSVDSSVTTVVILKFPLNFTFFLAGINADYMYL